MATTRKARLAAGSTRIMETIADPQGPYWYAQLIGLKKCDASSLQKRVLEGLSFASLEHLQASGDLTLAEVADLVQIKPRTLARRRDEGRLDADESDRVLRAARILGLAARLFEGDRAAARRWLSTPSRALDGQTPLEAARTGIGAREVERLIGQLEHGVAS